VHIRAGLVHPLEVPEEVLVIADVTPAERDGIGPAAEGAAGQGSRETALIFQIETVEIDGLPLLRPVSRPEAPEVTVAIGCVETGGADHHRADPEEVHIEVLAVPVSLDPLKGPPGIGPVQGGNEPLRTVA